MQKQNTINPKVQYTKITNNPLVNPKYLIDFDQYKIDWSSLTPEYFTEVFEHLYPIMKDEVDASLNKKFDDLIIDDFIQGSSTSILFSKYLYLLYFYNSVNRSDELTNITIKYSELMNNLFMDISFNKDYYDKLIKFKSLNYESMDDEQKQLIDDSIKNIENNGIHLPKDKQEKLKNLNNELSKLQEVFTNNSDKTQANTFIMINDLEFNTLTDSIKKDIKDNVTDIINGEYKISYNTGLISQIQKFSNDTNLRKKAFDAINTIGYTKDHDNYDAANNIVKKYYEISELLGYETPAKMLLTDNMVQDPVEIAQFAQKIIDMSNDSYIKDWNILEKESFNVLNRKPDLWDMPFVYEELDKKLFNLNSDEIKQYFPIKHVIDGFMDVFGNLYGIDFSYNKDKTWCDDVYALDLKDKSNGQYMGKIYLDMFMRNGKRSGGCCGELTSKSYDPDTDTFSPATVYIICNSPKNELNPHESLLEFNDIETLFHEFGHGFHHFFSKNKYSSLNGTSNVERDAVELPSQFMENFCYDKQVLDKISKNINTGEPLPQEMLDNIIKSENFLSSFAIRRYAVMDKMDNIIYTQKNVNIKEVEKQCFEDTMFLHKENNILNSKMIPTLPHIFTSGYQAQLYVYKWAEVYSCDTFNIFKQAGSTINEQTEKALEFKDKIYSKGGKGSLKNHWLDFKGEEVSFEPFFIKHGLSTESNTNNKSKKNKFK